MDDFKDAVKMMGGLIFGVCGFCFLLACTIQKLNIEFFDNVPVVCKVEGIVVYSGPSAGIKVLSTGDTTKVDIKGGFLYWFPKKYYVSHNVSLMGEK